MNVTGVDFVVRVLFVGNENVRWFAVPCAMATGKYATLCSSAVFFVPFTPVTTPLAPPVMFGAAVRLLPLCARLCPRPAAVVVAAAPAACCSGSVWSLTVSRNELLLVLLLDSDDSDSTDVLLVLVLLVLRCDVVIHTRNPRLGSRHRSCRPQRSLSAFFCFPQNERRAGVHVMGERGVMVMVVHY